MTTIKRFEHWLQYGKAGSSFVYAKDRLNCDNRPVARMALTAFKAGQIELGQKRTYLGPHDIGHFDYIAIKRHVIKPKHDFDMPVPMA